MDWTRVSVTVDGEAAEAVAEVLRPFAPGGVALEQVADDLTPEASGPVLPDRVTVAIYLSHADDQPATRRRIEEVLWHLGQIYPIPPPAFRTVREEDWANTWKQHYTAFRVGRRLMICPAWQPTASQPGDVQLLMDPGMAFGTGLHPTTRMCLEVVEAHAHHGTAVLDIGTGSGILAIAAAKLGAGPIRAVDNDPTAVRTAGANSRANGVGDRVQVMHASLADLDPADQWDLVLVNILAPVILQMLESGLVNHVRPGGLLVLSGIIEDQAPAIEGFLLARRCSLQERRQIRDWVTLVVRRPDGDAKNAACYAGSA